MTLLEGPTLPTIGTVRGFWNSPKVPGLSQTFGSLRLRNKPDGVGTLGLWDSLNVPGLSCAWKGLGTRFGGIWEKILEFSHVATEKFYLWPQNMLRIVLVSAKDCFIRPPRTQNKIFFSYMSPSELLHPTNPKSYIVWSNTVYSNLTYYVPVPNFHS